MRKLTAENVNEVFMTCLFQEGEEVLDATIVEGVVNKFGFNYARIEEHKTEISELLAGLPKGFQKDIGGGWSFLNACITKEGIQWGEHLDIEKLMCLGLASKQVELPIPRDMWGIIPGGVPYFMVVPLP